MILLAVKTSDNEYMYSVIDWKSIKTKRVAKSTTSAESIAMSYAVDAAIFIKRLVLEIFSLSDIPVLVYGDNKNVIDLCNSRKGPTSNTEKRVFIDILVIRELLEKGEISSVNFIGTKFLICDALTKHSFQSVHRLFESVKSGYLQISLPAYLAFMTYSSDTTLSDSENETRSWTKSENNRDRQYGYGHHKSKKRHSARNRLRKDTVLSSISDKTKPRKSMSKAIDPEPRIVMPATSSIPLIEMPRVNPVPLPLTNRQKRNKERIKQLKRSKKEAECQPKDSTVQMCLY